VSSPTPTLDTRTGVFNMVWCTPSAGTWTPPQNRHGRLAEDGVCRRAWMSAALASARHQDGGLELPRIREELLAMSASTVSRWLSAQSPLAEAVGGVLLTAAKCEGRPYIAPGRKVVCSPRVRSTLALSGWHVLSLAASHERAEDEDSAVAPLLALAG
jgi:hypothetical protein